jgi:hypothetical protein
LADPHAKVEMENHAAVWQPRAASDLTSSSWLSLAPLACRDAAGRATADRTSSSWLSPASLASRVAAGRATENRGHDWLLNCCLILANQWTNC